MTFLSRLIALAATFAFATALSASPRPLVIVVDGAGDFKGCSNAIEHAVKALDMPVDVEAFAWSHGHYKIYKDQIDLPYSRQKGKELAELLIQIKRARPNRPITIVSYSAGTAVALTACKELPDKLLERHIMFAPSVSKRYDVRPCLRACRRGADVFCSANDKWVLGFGVRLVGTADEFHDKEAAGRFGFQVIVDAAEDEKLFSALRQHFWKADDAKLGHNGKHCGFHAQAWLQRYVTPLLVDNDEISRK